MDEREEDDSMDDYDETDNDENMTNSSPVHNTRTSTEEGGVWPISPSTAELFNTLRNINTTANHMSDINEFMEEHFGDLEDEEYSEEEEEDDEISEPSPKRPRLSEPESTAAPETQEELRNLPQVHFFNKTKKSLAENSSLRTSSGGVSSLTSSTANLRASQNLNSSQSLVGNSTATDQDKNTVVPPIDQLALCTDFSSIFVYDAASFQKVAELANCLPSTPGMPKYSNLPRSVLTYYRRHYDSAAHGAAVNLQVFAGDFGRFGSIPGLLFFDIISPSSQHGRHVLRNYSGSADPRRSNHFVAGRGHDCHSVRAARQ